MYYSTSAKNTMLGALGVTQLRLHTGNPGAAGTANQYSGGGYAHQSVTFNAASDGKRTLSAAAVFQGTPDDAVSWLSYWAAGTFAGASQLDAGGDNAFDTDTGLLAVVPDDTYYEIDECA